MASHSATPRYSGFTYAHLLKAGGTEVTDLLLSGASDMWCDRMTHTCQWLEDEPQHYLLDTAHARIGGSLAGTRTRSVTKLGTKHGLEVRNASVFELQDGGRADGSPTPRPFRILGLREPCDYVVSLYEYEMHPPACRPPCVPGHGSIGLQCAEAAHANVSNFTSFLLKSAAPSMHWMSYRLGALLLGARWAGVSTAEQARHRHHMRGMLVSPTLEVSCPALAPPHRLAATEAALSDADARVDCWIRTEALHADLRRCLRMYVAGRGGANGTRFNLAQLERRLERTENKESGAKRKATPEASAARWDRPASSINRNQRRGACTSYYDAASAAFVWAREGRLAEAHGYKGCCGGLDARAPAEERKGSAAGGSNAAIASKLQALQHALDAGALSPALYQQAKHELERGGSV